MVSRKNFNKVWKDSSRESVLNQFYYEHYELLKCKEVIDKIENLLIIKKARCLNEDNYILNVSDLDTILNLVKEVSE